MNPILKRIVTGLAVGVAVVAVILLAPPCAILPAVSCLIVLAAAEYAVLLSKKVPVASFAWAAMFLVGTAVVAAGLLALPAIAVRFGDEPCGAFRLGNVMLLYMVAIVKFSDVGGFALGLGSAKCMKGGNHKMCPSISPGKSWEGLLGSVVLSCAVSCAFIPATRFGVGKALAFGVAAAILGTAGDLVESKFKRWVGVKDSSALKITNGMGGILDMLDSLIFAPTLLLPFL